MTVVIDVPQVFTPVVVATTSISRAVALFHSLNSNSPYHPARDQMVTRTELVRRFACYAAMKCSAWRTLSIAVKLYITTQDYLVSDPRDSVTCIRTRLEHAIALGVNDARKTGMALVAFDGMEVYDRKEEFVIRIKRIYESLRQLRMTDPAGFAKRHG